MQMGVKKTIHSVLGPNMVLLGGMGRPPPTPPRFSNTKLPCTEVGQNLEKKWSKLALDSIFLSNIFVYSGQPKKQMVILTTSWSTEHPLVSKMTK